MIDLLSSAVGGRVVSCNDEFFAEAANLIKPGPPHWDPEAFTDHGKWMDGWETRRRREEGFDWCVLALGIPGRIRRVTVDTSHFTGNFPEAFSLEACGAGSDSALGDAEWEEVVERTSLAGDTVLELDVDGSHRMNYLRFSIFPDGGVARLRVWGEPIPDQAQVCPGDAPTDLVSALVGGVALEASDHHYSPPSNLLSPTAPAGMWDGWETRRRRGPGHDWATFRLGLGGTIEQVDVDTSYFKGNAPGWVSVRVSEDGVIWEKALDRVAVTADRVNQLKMTTPVHASFVRLDIHPDGGLSRFRVWGRPDAAAAAGMRVAYLDALFAEEARRFFKRACASATWVSQMAEDRPFTTPEAVLAAARREFAALAPGDWLEAFAAHPRIGERGDAVSDQEQGAAAGADESILSGLIRVNQEYEQRFGFTYIVYATGKTAAEMLKIARRRLANDRQEEITVAAREQSLITETRLRRMLCMGA